MTAPRTASPAKRVCCLCGKRTRKAPDGSTESTIGYQTVIKALGLTGDKAHPSCLREARTKLASVEPPIPADWKVHTPRLLEEILTNPGTAILRAPLQIFGSILADVATRAGQINDPALNILMLRLTLYEQGDPDKNTPGALEAVYANERKRTVERDALLLEIQQRHTLMQPSQNPGFKMARPLTDAESQVAIKIIHEDRAELLAIMAPSK